jgi:hypothetical protein
MLSMLEPGGNPSLLEIATMDREFLQGAPLFLTITFF